MEDYIFEGLCQSKEKVYGLDDLFIDDDFHYSFLNEGMKISGNIYFSFVMKRELRKEIGSFSIPIDLFISLNEIDSLKDIKLEIDHFTFDIHEEDIHFKVFTKLKGNHEDLIRFNPTDNKEINEELVTLLMRKDELNLDDKVNEDSIKKMEEILTSKDIEFISTPLDKIKDSEDLIELTYEEVKENIEDNIKIDETKLEENKEKNEIKLEKNLDTTPSKQEVVTRKNEDLLKETYISNSFYYRLHNKETIDDIVSRFHLDKNELIKINPSKTFKEGELIKIPK